MFVYYLLVQSFIQIYRKANMEYELYSELIKNKGHLIECKSNNDCTFPYVCCNDPLLSFQFCCVKNKK